jgi:DNA polymerase IV (DinB-like DNA polymerase)
MKRIILHIDMDAFFAKIEERENPQFKGKPVVVGANPKRGEGRGVVSTCNYEARKYGIHSALPISRAYQLCPKAIFLPVNMELYQEVSERVMNIIKRYSQNWEIVSLDEAYLDVSIIKAYKKAEELAKNLKREIIAKEKLTSTIGIGPNKLIAKMAMEKAKPNGLLLVNPKQVKSFLEPLDVEDLPGIGPKTAGKLRDIKVNKIKELKELSKLKLKEMFGKAGESFYERARGIDEEPVISNRAVKSIGKEYTFERDTRDSEILFETFEEIIKGVWQELKENNFSFKTITVICRFSGFETHTRSKTFEKPSEDFKTLQKEAKKLLLKFIVENQKPIRLIGLRVKF